MDVNTDGCQNKNIKGSVVTRVRVSEQNQQSVHPPECSTDPNKGGRQKTQSQQKLPLSFLLNGTDWCSSELLKTSQTLCNSVLTGI